MNPKAAVLFALMTLPCMNGLQEDAKKETTARPVSAAAAKRECAKLEAQPRLPGENAGDLLKEARSACRDYRDGKLSAVKWSERIVALEERAAFVEAPTGFAGIIPFSD